MKQRGFTLIEVLVAVAVAGIVLAMVFGASGNNPNLTFGANGMTESRCIDGKRFIISNSHSGSSSVVQVLNADGKPETCNAF